VGKKVATIATLSFGLLTVVEQVEAPSSDRKGNRWWRCICECGNTTVVSTAKLQAKRGGIKSCGCKRLTDMWGKRFGRLVVIDRTEKREDGRARWLCECDCGARVERHGWQLTSRDSTSCGCALREQRMKFGGHRYGRD